jgi:hypothetical protein
MVMRLILLVVVTSFVVGCATRYGEIGFTGGVTAEPVMTDVYRIRARGNAYTDASRVQDFVLLKAAEVTLSAGGTHFVIVGQENRTNVVTGQTLGFVNTTVTGNTAFTTYTPGATYNLVKPGEDVMIKVVRITPGQPLPSGAFPAADIDRTIGTRLRQG